MDHKHTLSFSIEPIEPIEPGWRLPVFYDARMVVTLELESPSPRKPAEVVAEWQRRYPVEVHGYAPATVEDFYLAHQKAHIDGLLDLRIANGLDTHDREVADTLVWTSGSMIAAARHALRTGVAVSPTSGFHHAGHDYSWGFCTVNGLLVTACKLLAEDGLHRVGILDCDQHQGDGSEHIIDTLALHDRVRHFTGRTHYPRVRDGFFERLPALLASLRDCDLVLYQAGADQHLDDPLGGFLSSEDMRLRDRLVFEALHRHGIPVVWNLAGGYQVSEVGEQGGVPSIQKVLDLHNATLEECLRVYAPAPRPLH